MQEENSISTKEKEKEKDSEKELCGSGGGGDGGGGQAGRTLEERRRSMLDHHWAVPSKDRNTFSIDDEQQDSLNSDKVIATATSPDKIIVYLRLMQNQ